MDYYDEYKLTIDDTYNYYYYEDPEKEVTQKSTVVAISQKVATTGVSLLDETSLNRLRNYLSSYQLQVQHHLMPYVLFTIPLRSNYVS